MKELKTHPGWDWNAWFWVDKEEFAGEWKAGRCRYRIEKAVGQDTDGRLFLMVWVNHDPFDWRKSTQTFYELDLDKYIFFLDRAIDQGEVKPEERRRLIDKANAPFIPPWDIHAAVVVYQDGRYTLGQKDETPYLIADGKTYQLTCHPYEPCLYITGEGGAMTAVHNAFEPFSVLDSFRSGSTITSITGFEYDAKDFCRMVEYAADKVEIDIGAAEKVFMDRPKKKQTEAPPGKTPAKKENGDRYPDDPFYELIAEYPACVIDYCIVQDSLPYRGYVSHWTALAFACHRLFAADDDEAQWHYDMGKATAKEISAGALFAPSDKNGMLNYRRAFLFPPHGNGYTAADFDRLNAALFPNGTDGLEIYEWTTDWSDYFDDGHEWWGALCFTIYDKCLDRFVVILASATD